MRILNVLHTNILRHVQSLHASRAAALSAGVDSLLNGASLTITALGRHLRGNAKTKHNIKRMDRLLSNSHLHRERKDLYAALCHQLCQSIARPLVLVDWSDIVEQNRILLIRAALVVEGRAIPLYESVYPLKCYNSPRTHAQFLAELRNLLPVTCRPIVITDAGFRGPWFRAVQSLGWDWIGRVRNCVNYRLSIGRRWRQTTSLYSRATSNPQYLGLAELSSKRPYQCHLHLFKKLRAHRAPKRSVRHFSKHSTSLVFAKQQRDPWLIATSLSPEQCSSTQVMALYGRRMQIEASFRDLKSDQYGFGLNLSRSRNIERLNVLLLIAALATVCLWWVGLMAHRQQWQKHYQANSTSYRRVLSTPFLGAAVLKRNEATCTWPDFISAISLLRELIQRAQAF